MQKVSTAILRYLPGGGLRIKAAAVHKYWIPGYRAYWETIWLLSPVPFGYQTSTGKRTPLKTMNNKISGRSAKQIRRIWNDLMAYTYFKLLTSRMGVGNSE